MPDAALGGCRGIAPQVDPEAMLQTPPSLETRLLDMASYLESRARCEACWRLPTLLADGTATAYIFGIV